MLELLLIVAMSLSGDPQSDQIDEAAVRSAVAWSLPYVEERGQWWIDEKGCVSCHRVSFTVWTMAAAERQGFDVAAERVTEINRWALDASLTAGDDEILDGAKNLDGLAQLILARREMSGETQAEAYDRFAQLLIDGQEADGSWLPDGQLPSQKRSESETAAVSTIWNLLALAGSNEPRVVESVARGMEYLQSIEDAEVESTEWYAARMLLADAMEDAELVNELTRKLLEIQNADGGWGWLIGTESDAFATGQALFALSTVDAANVSTLTRLPDAVSWLLSNQQEDGSWQVHGTKAVKQDQIEETASYWGTCWAVLGLLRTLPETH